MSKTYFTNLADVDLAKEAMAKSGDWYIQFYEYVGTGVYALTTAGTSTLTPATSPSWDVDEFNSTVARNLLIVDDNNVVASAKIDDNDATSITFDETDALLESDGLTAATFTPASTYNFYVLTPSNINLYGPFFGYAESIELSLTDEMMQFKYGVPKKLKFQDLMERTGQITGGHVNVANTDIVDTFFGADNYGSQTSQFAKGIGSEPDTNRFYRLVNVSTDRNSRAMTTIVRKGQFAMNGNIIGASESGHKMYNFNFDILSDEFYPATADMLQLIRAD